MSKTFELYRCNADAWSHLTWKNALRARIHKAEQAKIYYRSFANLLDNKTGPGYNHIVKLYQASDKARLFNIAALEES